MAQPLKLVSIGTPAILAPQGIVKSFSYSGKGDNITSKVAAFGNSSSPIVDKTITLVVNDLLQITANFQGGLLDDKPPTLLLKIGIVVKLVLVMGFFPDNLLVGGLDAGVYTVQVEMLDIIDGGAAYSMSAFQGSIS